MREVLVVQEIIKGELNKINNCEFIIGEQKTNSVDELEQIVDSLSDEKITIKIKPAKQIYGRSASGRPLIIGGNK